MSDNSRLGTILDHTAYRDAVHVAIAPVTCDTRMYRAEPVKFISADRVERVVNGAYDGVVDPLLLQGAFPGERFYVWLKPGIARNVRHDWDHPKFPREKT